MAKHIASFFDRLKNLTVPDGAVREAVAGAVKEMLGAEIDRTHVRIQGVTAYLDIAPALKAELQFRQKELLERTAHILGKNAVLAIR